MNICAHPDCTTEIAGHELACRPHWYELPTPLRNRIWRHYRSNRGGPDHLAAIAEAHQTWKPAAARIRCHNCRQPADFTDVDTGQPTCIPCTIAGIDPTSTPGPCSKCGRHLPDDLLVSLTDRPPHLCIDCTITDLLHVEALT